MQAQGLSRRIQELGPNTNFAGLLKDEFDVEVPVGALKYQSEYLYKYCLQEAFNQTPKELIVDIAAGKVAELTEKFPWIVNKYETTVVDEDGTTVVAKARSKKYDHPDGTITYGEWKGKMKYMCFIDGKMVYERKDLEKLKAIVEKKFGKVVFNLIGGPDEV